MVLTEKHLDHAGTLEFRLAQKCSLSVYLRLVREECKLQYTENEMITCL